MAVHLVILWGVWRERVRGSSSGSSISLMTNSFTLLKCKILCPRALSVNPLTLHVCFPCFVL